MITNKKELLYYLEQDRIALKREKLTYSRRIAQLLLPDVIWRFERLLRYTEYYNNKVYTSKFAKVWGTLFKDVYKYRLRKMSMKLGFSIPCNSFGPGLSIAHYGTIIVNPKAKIGANCRLHACVNIGASAGKKEAPIIGDNCYIGPGAILFGDIHIASNVTIAANATVNRSCEEEHVVLAGTPAKIVKENAQTWLEFNQVNSLI